MSDQKPGIAIVGPTSSGKTGLAISLALQFNGEIVGCDALQVYRHMDIGTAKASPSEQQLVPHHMIDVQDPDFEFSAGDYQRMAREIVEQISLKGHLPFVTGGTGFYLRALIDGLFEGPERSEALRQRMRGIIARKGPQVLHRALARVDSRAASRIAEADAERIIRAYEVYLSTGTTMSWWQEQPRNAFAGYRWLKIGIDMPREELYARINRRVEEMFQSGFIEEVHELRRRYPTSIHAFKAIGYRQVVQYIDGAISLRQAIEETQLQSRHYAKRQMTWFRADRSIIWLKPDGIEQGSASLILDFLCQ